jgi:hypothetical protein
MTGTNCDLFTHKQSRSYLNHLVHITHSQTFKEIHTCLKINFYLLFLSRARFYKHVVHLRDSFHASSP